MTDDDDSRSEAEVFNDILKVLGTGNGTGIVLAAAALKSFDGHPIGIWVVKFSALSFSLGILAFAVAFLFRNIMWYQDRDSRTIGRDTGGPIGPPARKNENEIKGAKNGNGPNGPPTKPVDFSETYEGRARSAAAVSFGCFLFGFLTGIIALMMA